MNILGIETSCDETAAAVVQDGQKMLSNVVASSVDLHVAYGGVVPEIAARSHLEFITPVISQALADAKADWEDIDAIAVTYGPGLGGSLLIGAMTAKTLAIAKSKPLYAINHVEAHIYANFIAKTSLGSYKLPTITPSLPLLALIVSGGHSHLMYVKKLGEYKVIGRTLDDAVGEAFDKVAKMLGLPYPGGPSIAKAAESGDPFAHKFPKPNRKSGGLGEFDFSFSGLKTAVLRTAQTEVGADFTLPSSQLPHLLNQQQKTDIAASFQQIALEDLTEVLVRATLKYNPTSVVIGGGVAANHKLRKMINNTLKTGVEYTDIRLCTDNAAMIATLAFYKPKGSIVNPYTLEINPSLIT